MGLDGCGKCMKYTMIAANFIIMVGGLTVMAIGIWTCVEKSSYENLLDNNLYMSAAYILIATGVIVVIISVIGCLGALRDIKCLLLTYFIILFIIFVIMLVGGILAYVYRNQVREELINKMKTSLQNEYEMRSEITETWDIIQKQFKCCGTALDEEKNNVKAWKKNSKIRDQSIEIPESCCRRDDKGEIVDKEKCQKLEGDTYYTEDCYNATISEIEHQSLILGGVGIGIACILILGMIFSMVLFKLIE